MSARERRVAAARLDAAFKKVEAEKDRPPTGELEFHGRMVQAEEDFLRSAASVDKNPEAVLTAARAYTDAITAWLKAKGAIPS